MTRHQLAVALATAIGLAVPGARAQDATTGPAIDTAAAASVTERLASIMPAWRSNARLEIELPAAAPEQAAALAIDAREDWNDGRWDDALDRLSDLESITHFAAGVAWRTPVSSGLLGPGFGDVRIGFPRESAQSATLDYDAQTGNLFAVVHWGEPDFGWTANISLDGGLTWFETFYWMSSYDLTDVDAAVVDDYLYVGYLGGITAAEVRSRRHLVSTGAADAAYAFLVVATTDSGSFLDVAAASNADDFDNRIYFGAIESDNAIRWFFATEQGATFIEWSPEGFSATRGLDMHWNKGFTDHHLYLSYLGTDGTANVLGLSDATGWNHMYDSPAVSSSDTSVSAHEDTVIYGFEYAEGGTQGIRYMISYDDGVSWLVGDIADPQPGEGDCHNLHLTARGGVGTAVLYGQEVGEPDPLWFRRREGYAGGPWTTPVVIADHDLITGMPLALNWVPPFAGGSWAYGGIYLSSGYQPYFLRVPSTCPADITGPAQEPDGNVDALDYLLLISQWGDLCGGECAADITGPNLVPDGTVDALDFLLLISQWGNPGQCPPSP